MNDRTEPGRPLVRTAHRDEGPGTEDRLLDIADALADHAALLELADALADQATRLRGHYEQLGHSLGPLPADGEPGGAGASANLVREMAVDMAVSGRTRRDVRTYLREAFGVVDTEDLLDEVFGYESEQLPDTQPRGRFRRLTGIGRSLVHRRA